MSQSNQPDDDNDDDDALALANFCESALQTIPGPDEVEYIL